jgi:hypothetical protein
VQASRVHGMHVTRATVVSQPEPGQGQSGQKKRTMTATITTTQYGQQTVSGTMLVKVQRGPAPSQPRRGGQPAQQPRPGRTVDGDGVGLDAAVDLAAQRFPEIEVERCDTTGDGDDARVLWTCRAPSETHLHRWAAGARFAVASLRRLSTHRLSRPTEGNQR